MRGHHDTDEMSPNKLFPYTNALPVLRGIAEKTGSSVMALFNALGRHGALGAALRWPPYGGEENFRAFADALHAEGNLLGVYCSGLGWTQKSHLVDYSREEQFEKEQSAKDHVRRARRFVAAQQHLHRPAQRVRYVPRLRRNRAARARAGGKNCRGGRGLHSDSRPEPTAATAISAIRIETRPQTPARQMAGARNAQAARSAYRPKTNRFWGCESAAADCFLDMLRFSDNRFEW